MMTDMHGRCVWYELITTDTAAAVEFYREVIGWAAQGAGVEGVDYTLLMANGAAVAGLMALPEEVRNAGGRPGWIGYVAVDDVDRSEEHTSELQSLMRNSYAVFSLQKKKQ